MVRISGRLVEPADDKPRSGVTLSLFSVKNSGTVLKHATYRCTTGGNGEYSFNAAPGSYDVAVSAYGSEPERVGRINVYEDSPPGSLNSFLLRPDEDDFTPEIIRIVQALADSASASSSLSTKEANRSKAEADRAKSEADRAKQISGLGTVEDAIALAAVPFPDVWIPFNDSLRMFAGYGREVKVGDDVVARMVNFERATAATYIDKSGKLRTAEINEPRFEKQGLLIEGQSTNLVVRSEGTTFQIANASFQTLTNNVSGVLPVVGQRILFAANNNETNAGLIQASMTLDGGSSYTYSLFIKVEDGDDSDLANCLAAYSPASASITNRAVIQDFGNGVKRLSGNISVGGTGSQTVYIRVQRRGAWATTTWTAVVGGVQVESLPFASSYIPTNGTAVTRAADVCYIQTRGNINPIEHGSTFALQFDTAGDGTFVSADTGGFGAFNRLEGRLRYTFRNGVVTNFKEQSGNVVCVRAVGRTALCLDGKIAQNTDTLSDRGDLPQRIWFGRFPNGGQPIITGHIRNFRIWHHALSDTQLRGLK